MSNRKLFDYDEVEPTAKTLIPPLAAMSDWKRALLLQHDEHSFPSERYLVEIEEDWHGEDQSQIAQNKAEAIKQGNSSAEKLAKLVAQSLDFVNIASKSKPSDNKDKDEDVKIHGDPWIIADGIRIFPWCQKTNDEPEPPKPIPMKKRKPEFNEAEERRKFASLVVDAEQILASSNKYGYTPSSKMIPNRSVGAAKRAEEISDADSSESESEIDSESSAEESSSEDEDGDAESKMNGNAEIKEKDSPPKTTPELERPKKKQKLEKPQENAQNSTHSTDPTDNKPETTKTEPTKPTQNGASKPKPDLPTPSKSTAATPKSKSNSTPKQTPPKRKTPNSKPKTPNNKSKSPNQSKAKTPKQSSKPRPASESKPQMKRPPMVVSAKSAQKPPAVLAKPKVLPKPDVV